MDRETASRTDDHQALRLWLRLLTCSQIIEREVRSTMERILDTWPAAISDLPASKSVTDAIFGQWQNLALVNDVRPAVVQGHDAGGEEPAPSSIVRG